MVAHVEWPVVCVFCSPKPHELCMTLSNPCSIGNARAALLCVSLESGNEKRRPLSSHICAG